MSDFIQRVTLDGEYILNAIASIRSRDGFFLCDEDLYTAYFLDTGYRIEICLEQGNANTIPFFRIYLCEALGQRIKRIDRLTMDKPIKFTLGEDSYVLIVTINKLKHKKIISLPSKILTEYDDHNLLFNKEIKFYDQSRLCFDFSIMAHRIHYLALRYINDKIHLNIYLDEFLVDEDMFINAKKYKALFRNDEYSYCFDLKIFVLIY